MTPLYLTQGENKSQQREAGPAKAQGVGPPRRLLLLEQPGLGLESSVVARPPGAPRAMCEGGGGFGFPAARVVVADRSRLEEQQAAAAAAS